MGKIASKTGGDPSSRQTTLLDLLDLHGRLKEIVHECFSQDSTFPMLLKEAFKGFAVNPSSNYAFTAPMISEYLHDSLCNDEVEALLLSWLFCECAWGRPAK